MRSRIPISKTMLSRLLVGAVILLSTIVCDILPPSAGLPSEEPPIPATDAPGASWLPDGTIALYLVGPRDARRLHAVAADRSTTDLGEVLYDRPEISRTGRWVASTGAPSPSATVRAVNLETGDTIIAPLTPDFSLNGLAFDYAETRMAYVELGQFTAESYDWAVVVVNLTDGSTVRHEMTMSLGSDPELLPGKPVGWSNPGNELLLDTFLPGTEGSWRGVWAVTILPGVGSGFLETLSRREVIPYGDYLLSPRLSPDGSQLAYLNRDFTYTPDNYEVIAYDLAVNELWTVSSDGTARQRLINVIDGGALGSDALSWSPDGTQILFAQGTFAGSQAFASLTLKVRDSGGALRDVGPAPIPAGGWLMGVDWCTPDLALATVAVPGTGQELHIVDMTSGATSLVDSADRVQVLGCIP
jgi:hypothetical protein